MKKILSCVGAVLLGGILVATALSPSQVGRVISDADASAIAGGCNGAKSINCTGCPATYICSAQQPSAVVDPGGDQHCCSSHCFSGDYSCGG